MALDPKITSLKAAGTYRFEFDKSQVVSIPAEQTRLIIGFSKKGPVNTPVFVPDTSFFKQVFGEIDRNLEKKDSFFQRSCLTALERGPILALNLLRLDDDVDVVEYIKMATACTPHGIQSNGPDPTAPYSGMFNQDKFWYPDTDSFLKNIGYSKSFQTNTNNLLDFTNIGKTPLSIIVKKAAAANVAGFEVTVKEWYGAANVPGYLDGDSLISDFMVDIFVITGNWGGDWTIPVNPNPYERFDADPTFQTYFDKTKGMLRKINSDDSTDTKLQAFFNEPEVNLQAQYTACLLPNFVDQLGNNLFVENMVNSDTATTGLYCAVNEDLFDGETLLDGVAYGIDMIGHNLEWQQSNGGQADINFLSYEDGISADYEFCRESVGVQTVTPAAGVVSINTAGDITLTVPSGDPAYVAFSGMVAHSSSGLGSYIQENAGANFFYVPVININITPGSVTLTLSVVNSAPGNFNLVGVPLNYCDPADMDQVVMEWNDSTPYAPGPAAVSQNIIASTGTALYSQYASGALTTGDEALFGDISIVGGTYRNYLDFNAVNYAFIHTADLTVSLNVATISDPDYYIPSIQIVPYEDADFATPMTKTALNNNEFQLDTDIPGYVGGTHDTFYETDNDPVAQHCLLVQSLKGSLNEQIDIIADSSTEPTLYPNQVLIAAPNGAVEVGNYLVHDSGTVSGHSRLTRINVVKGGQTPAEWPAAGIPVGTTALFVECQSEIEIRSIGGQDAVELYYPIDSWIDYLNVFTLDGFTLRADYSIPDGTNDRQNEILYDTLGGTPLYKALTDRDVISFRYVVETFGNGIESGSKAIYYELCKDRKNAFAITSAPSAQNFKDSTNPSFLDVTGALSMRMISEGGDLAKNPTVRYSLPSMTQGASWGAFYFPFITVRDLGKNINVPPASYVSNNFIDKYATALPWSLVAGVRRGVVGGAGVVGLEINLDKQDREYLEPFGLNPIVFQTGTGPTIFANKTAQQTIKSALSSINCREVVIYIQDGIEAILKNYLFEFNTPQTRLEIKTLADNFLSTVQNDDGVYDFRNVMDESNNTPEVIDQNIGILDTYIEPVRGMEILVQRTTILKTGAISTGNFM